MVTIVRDLSIYDSYQSWQKQVWYIKLKVLLSTKFLSKDPERCAMLATIGRHFPRWPTIHFKCQYLRNQRSDRLHFKACLYYIDYNLSLGSRYKDENWWPHQAIPRWPPRNVYNAHISGTNVPIDVISTPTALYQLQPIKCLDQL